MHWLYWLYISISHLIGIHPVCEFYGFIFHINYCDCFKNVRLTFINRLRSLTLVLSEMGGICVHFDEIAVMLWQLNTPTSHFNLIPHIHACLSFDRICHNTAFRNHVLSQDPRIPHTVCQNWNMYNVYLCTHLSVYVNVNNSDIVRLNI